MTQDCVSCRDAICSLTSVLFIDHIEESGLLVAEIEAPLSSVR